MSYSQTPNYLSALLFLWGAEAKKADAGWYKIADT